MCTYNHHENSPKIQNWYSNAHWGIITTHQATSSLALLSTLVRGVSIPLLWDDEKRHIFLSHQTPGLLTTFFKYFFTSNENLPRKECGSFWRQNTRFSFCCCFAFFVFLGFGVFLGGVVFVFFSEGNISVHVLELGGKQILSQNESYRHNILLEDEKEAWVVLSWELEHCEQSSFRSFSKCAYIHHRGQLPFLELIK